LLSYLSWINFPRGQIWRRAERRVKPLFWETNPIGPIFGYIYIYIYKAPKTEEEEKVHRIHSKRYVSKQIPRVRWGLQLGLSLWLCLSGKEKEQFLWTRSHGYEILADYFHWSGFFDFSVLIYIWRFIEDSALTKSLLI